MLSDGFRARLLCKSNETRAQFFGGFKRRVKPDTGDIVPGRQIKSLKVEACKLPVSGGAACEGTCVERNSVRVVIVHVFDRSMFDLLEPMVGRCHQIISCHLIGFAETAIEGPAFDFQPPERKIGEVNVKRCLRVARKKALTDVVPIPVRNPVRAPGNSNARMRQWISPSRFAKQNGGAGIFLECAKMVRKL